MADLFEFLCAFLGFRLIPVDEQYAAHKSS